MRFQVIFLLFFFSFVSSVSATPLKHFRLSDSPLVEFIDWVAINSGESIIVSSSVTGNISLLVQSLESDDLMLFLEDVLFANNYSLISKNDLFIVVPLLDNLISEKVNLESRVYTLEYLPNELAKNYIDNLLASTAGVQNDLKKQPPRYFVTLLPVSNSFLVSAPVDSLDLLSQYLSVIDKALPQVLIEAVITENNFDDSTQDGFSFASALVSNGFSAVSGLIPTAGLTGGSSGLTAVFSSGGSIRAFVDFLSSNSDTNILSTPRLVVRDRKRGKISVGQNVPFLVAQETTEGGQLINRIERHDVGVSLTITPRIIGKTIQLDIIQVSSSVATSSQASDIITNKRHINTSITLQDGQAVLLGGLIVDTERKIKKGVPVLMSIPVFGRVFSSSRKELVKMEMNVLIKATIL